MSEGDCISKKPRERKNPSIALKTSERILNMFVKPILSILTLPITIITLGLFSFVINVALLYLAAYLVPGFFIEGILAALLFGLAVSFISSFLNMLAE